MAAQYTSGHAMIIKQSSQLLISRHISKLLAANGDENRFKVVS